MTPRGRFGAFVYTVVPWAWVVGGLGIAIVYTNGRIGPLRAGLGRLCTLLRLARIVRATVRTQECTQIGGNGPSAPFRGVCVHCCDASRDTNRDTSSLRQVARAPQPPWRVGGTSSLAPLAWSERQALREWRRREVGIFAEASTHTSPRRASDYGQQMSQCQLTKPIPMLRIAAPDGRDDAVSLACLNLPGSSSLRARRDEGVI